MFLALDPGHTTGWAFLGAQGYSEDLEPHGLSFGQVKGQEALWRHLRAIRVPPSVIIYETYRVRPGVSHNGSEIETIQNIGIIKAYAYEINAKLVKQEPTVKKMGYGWIQMAEATNHRDSHRRDALAHATYYVMTNEIREIRRIEDKHRRI
jgi:hypothetical protein